jgi:hypothetical protein
VTGLRTYHRGRGRCQGLRTFGLLDGNKGSCSPTAREGPGRLTSSTVSFGMAIPISISGGLLIEGITIELEEFVIRVRCRCSNELLVARTGSQCSPEGSIWCLLNVLFPAFAIGPVPRLGFGLQLLVTPPADTLRY